MDPVTGKELLTEGYIIFKILNSLTGAQKGFEYGTLDRTSGSLVYTDAFPNAPVRKGERTDGTQSLHLTLETIRAGNQAKVGLSTPPTSPILLSRLQTPQRWLCFGHRQSGPQRAITAS